MRSAEPMASKLLLSRMGRSKAHEGELQLAGDNNTRAGRNSTRGPRSTRAPDAKLKPV